MGLSAAVRFLEGVSRLRGYEERCKLPSESGQGLQSPEGFALLSVQDDFSTHCNVVFFALVEDFVILIIPGV